MLAPPPPQKKDWQNPTLLTLDWEPCQLFLIWFMPLALEHCHTGSVFMVANLKKDRQNLTLMTLDSESCKLVQMLLMTLL